MKKTYWLVTFIIFLCCFSQVAKAQLTNTHAIGVRFGAAQGISYRYTLAEDRALTGLLSVQSNHASRRFRVVGLYEFYKPLGGDFSWYYGFGGSVGSYKSKAYTSKDGSQVAPYSEALVSLDGILGISYDVPDVPLVISLDVKPYLDFIQSSTIKLIDPIGFTVRYKF
ncbi:hypothetical protein J5U18_10270 [Sphingobacteriaceae bacterium WQ 2009]|uniref:DUF3575 domain-containing protein n=1 Tax=Rhinopithecimicrobium faecis TaxID=2820698 RepID=A0A8T4HCE5_9SPHI|nr:hypothetical protein [Sphingobacteriaceae bacterium WQ 2009]